MENQLVVFELAHELYSLDISAVESIIMMQPITPVPHAPPFVQGVTNLRGKVLPVIDLRQRFYLPVAETTKETRIIVVEIADETVGMIVDATTEVLRIPPEAVKSPASLMTTINSAFITGIAKVDRPGPATKGSASGQLVILLDLDKVLSPEEKADLQTLPAAA